MIEQTFIFIKPDGVERSLVGDIIKRFEAGKLKIKALEMVWADDNTLSLHYPLSDRNYVLTLGHVDISGKSDQELEDLYQKNSQIIKKLQDYIQSGPIVKMVLEGEGAVEVVRDIVGKTNPAQADKGTIRGDLGDDSFEQADKEERSVRNLVHASGTNEEAEKEIKLWFPGRSAGNISSST